MRYINNPPNPYLKYDAEFVGEPPVARLEIFEETSTKSIISKSYWQEFERNRFTVNCYRGCVHGCTYCFARQYHEYLGYGAGTDFETKIVVKVNAPDLLRTELKRTRTKIHRINFSFATDPYLPLEANYRLTRNCLEVCNEFQIPVGVITKSPLVRRDVDVLKKLKATVFFSIPFLTTEKSKPFEPYTPTPDARFRAMGMLADAGIEVGIGIAPIIPGYNDCDIPALLEKAKNHGAADAFMGLIHFDTDSIESYFVQRLEEKLPTKSNKILHQLKRERGGNLRHKNYEERNKGKTEQWKIAERLFELHYNRLGFERTRPIEAVTARPQPVQQSLFD